MNKRESQREQRKKEILEKALDLFIKKGYGATKIADIAKAVNMSMGLMFHYFPSKEKLYTELIKIGSSKLQLAFPTDVNCPLEFLNNIVESFFSLIKTSPFGAKMFVLMENASHLDIIPEELKGLVLAGNKLVLKTIPLIEKGQSLGEIREGDPYALAILFWSSIQGIAQYFALDSSSPFPKSEWIISLLRK